MTVRRFLLTRLERRFARYVAAGQLPRGCKTQLAADMLISLNFQLGFIDREVLRISPREIKRRVHDYATVFARGIAATR